MHTEKMCSCYRITKRYFLKTKRKCRCFYCRSNRQYANMKRLLSAEEKLRENGVWAMFDLIGDALSWVGDKFSDVGTAISEAVWDVML